MAEFVCRLGAPDGSVLEQRRVAPSQDALRRELETEGFHVFSMTSAGSRFRLPFFGRSEKVTGQDFLLFNTQLRTLLRAGLPLAQSLDLLKQQQKNPHFRAMLNKIHQQVTTGVSLSDAFLALGDAFPRLYANSLRAGERSGELEDVLGRYVEYQKMVEAARKKIIAALTYPAVLVALSVGLVIVLMAYVIPSFSEFYVNFEQRLPLPTRVVMGISDFTQQYLLYIVVGAVAAGYGLKAWGATTTGRRIMDRLKLRVPFVGRIDHLFSMSQFTRSMSVLLGAGTPMVPALETAATSVGNSYVGELFLGCVRDVQEGRALSDSLEDTNHAPDLALAMIRVGEGTGALPEMLDHSANFFDEEIEFSLGRMVTLFEPMVLVFMGLVIAGLLLSVYYPLLTLVAKVG